MALLPFFAVTGAAAVQVVSVGRHAGFVAAADFLIFADVGTERWIREYEIEAPIENAVDVEQAIVIMDAAMPVAVHDHVHLGGTRGTRFGVSPVDALPSQFAYTGVDGLVVFATGQNLLIEQQERLLDFALFLIFRQLECFDSLAFFVFLPLNVGDDLCTHVLEGTDQKSTRAGGRIADKLAFLRVKQVDHEIHDRTWGKELAQLTAEGCAKEFFKRQTLDVVTRLG